MKAIEMNIKKATNHAVLGSENYHEIMKTIAVYSLQKKASFIAPIEEDAPEEPLSFDVKWNYPIKVTFAHLERIGEIYRLGLISNEPICYACLRALKIFLNGKYGSAFTIECDCEDYERCFVCGEKCDGDIPF
jgi:hypothetical protein